MNILLDYGLSLNNIVEIIEKYPSIRDIDDDLIKDKIDILEYIGCSKKAINNIITSNPDFLMKDIDDINSLIKKLKDLKIQRLDITFDSNPWLLNIDSNEIDEFINEKKKTMDYKDIIDLIDKGEVEW